MPRRPIRTAQAQAQHDRAEQLARWRAFVRLSIAERKQHWRQAPTPPAEEVVTWGRVCGICVWRPAAFRATNRRTAFCTKVQGRVHLTQTCGQFKTDQAALLSLQYALGRQRCTTCKFWVLKGDQAYCGLGVPLAEQTNECPHHELSPWAQALPKRVNQTRDRLLGKRPPNHARPVKVYYQRDRPNAPRLRRTPKPPPPV